MEERALESVVANHSMVDDFDEAASDAEGAGDAGLSLLAVDTSNSEGCWWSTFVYPCSDVAASNVRIKMRSQGLVRFPRSVVFGVADVAHLAVLDLCDNNITALPSWLRQLTGLNELLLSNNRISEVDPVLYEMRSLRWLSLENNQIHFFHRELLQMELDVLRVEGNPLGWPPLAVAQSSASLRRWASAYKSPPTYRHYVGPRGPFRHLDVTWHAQYYLGPDKDKNEDRHVVMAESVAAGDTVAEAARGPDSDVLLRPRVLYWGIYDGHSGHAVAVALEQFLYSKLEAGGCFDAFATDAELTERVKRVYLECDAKICEYLRAQKSRTKRKPGSCCTAVWLIGTRLVVSHVGDSRVIMVDSNGAVDELAPDHHPDAPRERERVEGRGGEIVFRGCWRVHSPQEGMYLAVSRAFGDVSLKEPTLIIDAEPDVTIRHIVPANRWLIIASDGLWCRLDNDPAAAAIAGCDTAQEATERLIYEAKALRTHDNTTVIVVRLDAAGLQ